MKMEEKITIQKKNEILNGLVVALKLQVLQLENQIYELKGGDLNLL